MTTSLSVDGNIYSLQKPTYKQSCCNLLSKVYMVALLYALPIAHAAVTRNWIELAVFLLLESAVLALCFFPSSETISLANLYL